MGVVWSAAKQTWHVARRNQNLEKLKIILAPAALFKDRVGTILVYSIRLSKKDVDQELTGIFVTDRQNVVAYASVGESNDNHQQDQMN